MNPYKYLLKHLSHLSKDYQNLVVTTYLQVLVQIFANAKWELAKGLFYSTHNKLKKEQAFMEGSRVWGKKILELTKTELHIYGDTNVPKSEHMIFINHVNELDFPFDSYLLQKPYLANQVIKNTYVAYWWMKAMGSEVFDTSNQRSISFSVRNLQKGLKDHSYVVYPEGHNSYSEEIKMLKKGMVKLAFDNKIPIFLILKSGIAKLQEKQTGNHIGYKFYGIIKPEDFKSHEELKEFIFKTMVEEKKFLDDELNKFT